MWWDCLAEKKEECHSLAVGHGMKSDEIACQKRGSVTHKLLVIGWNRLVQKGRSVTHSLSIMGWNVMRFPGKWRQCHLHAVGHGMRCHKTLLVKHYSHPSDAIWILLILLLFQCYLPTIIYDIRVNWSQTSLTSISSSGYLEDNHIHFWQNICSATYILLIMWCKHFIIYNILLTICGTLFKYINQYSKSLHVSLSIYHSVCEHPSGSNSSLTHMCGNFINTSKITILQLAPTSIPLNFVNV